MSYYTKYSASRIIRGQVLGPWTGSGTLVSTTFSSQISEVRVISQINGWIAIEPSATQGTVMSTSTFVGGTFIAANTANGDTFACTPGMVLTFTSSTTSTGVLVSVAEVS